ncbi:MAG: hypothetical protein Greene07144_107 [Parcubacteria group bacterium Greene0714_4]|nr:MAG: hypothetical protein Greene07144_107 [Parcubacteria group bacterium Greene0714_4]
MDWNVLVSGAFRYGVTWSALSSTSSFSATPLAMMTIASVSASDKTAATEIGIFPVFPMLSSLCVILAKHYITQIYICQYYSPGNLSYPRKIPLIPPFVKGEVERLSHKGRVGGIWTPPKGRVGGIWTPPFLKGRVGGIYS